MTDKHKPHVTHNSGNNEWYTPAYIIEASSKTMGTIDPATYFTIDDDGLSKEWRGNIWLNPPYSGKLIEKFADKLLTSDFAQAIVLVNNATDTKWFTKLADKADAIVFPKGRIKYLSPDGVTHNSPIQGQAILYFGNNVNAFKKYFGQFGRCWI